MSQTRLGWLSGVSVRARGVRLLCASELVHEVLSSGYWLVAWGFTGDLARWKATNFGIPVRVVEEGHREPFVCGPRRTRGRWRQIHGWKNDAVNGAFPAVIRPTGKCISDVHHVCTFASWHCMPASVDSENFKSAGGVILAKQGQRPVVSVGSSSQLTGFSSHGVGWRVVKESKGRRMLVDEWLKMVCRKLEPDGDCLHEAINELSELVIMRLHRSSKTAGSCRVDLSGLRWPQIGRVDKRGGVIVGEVVRTPKRANGEGFLEVGRCRISEACSQPFCLEWPVAVGLRFWDGERSFVGFGPSKELFG